MKRYLVLSLLAAIWLLSCFGCDTLCPPGPRGGGYMMHYGFGYGAPYLGTIFLIVICLAIYFIVRAWKRKGRPPHQESPLDVLKRRYANGEIAKEEFERMKKDLEG